MKRDPKSNPDRALASLDGLFESLTSARAQSIVVGQGTRFVEKCPREGCPGTDPIAKLKKTARETRTRDVRPSDYEWRCVRCNTLWEAVDVDTHRNRKRPKEVARLVTDERAMNRLADLRAAIEPRPAGFKAKLWALHLAIWRAYVHGVGNYGDLAELFEGELVAWGFGASGEVSGRTVARIVRVARDLVESRLIEQQSGERAAELRYALA